MSFAFRESHWPNHDSHSCYLVIDGEMEKKTAWWFNRITLMQTYKFQYQGHHNKNLFFFLLWLLLMFKFPNWFSLLKLTFGNPFFDLYMYFCVPILNYQVLKSLTCKYLCVCVCVCHKLNALTLSNSSINNFIFIYSN